MKISTVNRLGLAWSNLNGWEWDEYIGDKPNGYDEMLNYSNDKMLITKDILDRPIMNFIERIIGEKNCSRCWWKYKLGKGYFKWVCWWYFHRKLNKMLI